MDTNITYGMEGTQPSGSQGETDQQRREREERERNKKKQTDQTSDQRQTSSQLGPIGMTRDHGIIQQWITSHGGHPARLRGIEGSDRGLLFVDFGQADERIERTTWQDFFYRFDKNHLAFFYDEIMSRIMPSKSFKFIFS